MNYLWNNSVLDGMRSFLQYFQLFYLIEKGSNSLNLIILYICFAILLLMTILIIICFYKPGKKFFATKVLNFYGIVLQKLLILPFLNIFFSTIICISSSNAHKESECY